MSSSTFDCVAMSELDEKCVMSCDDEGYETPGKKEHPVPAKPASKHDVSCIILSRAAIIGTF